MPLPENTLPMMGGEGPFGSVEMGGMFSILKVRKHQKPGDHTDSGWFKHPPGTLAHEVAEKPSEPVRHSSGGGQSMPRAQKNTGDVEVHVRKPAAGSGHGGH